MVPVVCLVFAFCFCGADSLSAQGNDVQYIETEIGLDQMVYEGDEPRDVQPGYDPGREDPEAFQGMEETEDALAPDSPLKPMDEKQGMVLDEEQWVIINRSLKNAIEENKRLLDESKSVETELKELRGQKEIRRTRISTLTRQRDELRKRIEEAESINSQYEKNLKELKSQLEGKEKTLSEKIEELKNLDEEKAQMLETGFFWTPEELESAEPEIKKVVSKIAELNTENKELRKNSLRLLSDLESNVKTTFHEMTENARRAAGKIAMLNKENETLKRNSAKLHYNLANIFFERGDYNRAVIEYKKVLDIIPYDPSAHYNLAFVSGEYLEDYETAYEHYQQYLMLHPNAEDLDLVKEKVLEAKLKLRTRIDSPIEGIKSQPGLP